MSLSTRDRNHNHKQGEHDDEDDFLPNPVKKPSSNSKPAKRIDSTSDLGLGSFESVEVHESTFQTRKSSVVNGQTRNKESSQPQKKERSKSKENWHQNRNKNQDGEVKKSNSGSGTNGTGRSRRSIVDREEEELKLALELSLKEASGITVEQKEGTVNDKVTEAAKCSGNLDGSVANFPYILFIVRCAFIRIILTNHDLIVICAKYRFYY
ncbi:hypothetical protein BKA69DRAFT_942377 [Paraphysoderma sedebokerense]|nr:hypothetical protein BKA69DRAFT_942377 [Paraphysoderma sedebokerense]